ncbi:hypothetical protein CTP10_R08260 [Cupriavidus sp. P-10]|uniref:hypothetical protein n=1 Tax=unclassified Cupriavidus TaxID=2640874 RepID=UPI0011C16B56|nr:MULTISPECIES: hypothetical protein [unclassified Cupriavidus]BDB23495.1 hypothetical protein CTP10_R08260 [Cupriavidus sp. P-10]
MQFTSTDDKESAIIAIFIDLVIFPLSGGHLAAILCFREAFPTPVAGAGFGCCSVPNSIAEAGGIDLWMEQSVAFPPSTLSLPNH